MTHYEHDENGNVIRIKTPRGFEIRKSYDGNDRLMEEQTIDKKNGINQKLRYTYDAAGNVLSETIEGAGDIPGAIGREFQYDLRNRLTHEISGSGASSEILL